MFNSISWTQYFFALIILLFLFYTIIGFRFYRWELLGFIGIKKVTADLQDIHEVLNNPIFNDLTDKQEMSQPEQTSDSDSSSLLRLLSDEISAYINTEKDESITKDEVLASLKAIFKKYPSIKKLDLQISMEQELLYEIQLKYPHLIQKNDMEILWK